MGEADSSSCVSGDRLALPCCSLSNFDLSRIQPFLINMDAGTCRSHGRGLHNFSR
uniref:Uncharacterized protein n=1 Tax=Physcomitrium patens TaxID=3218 RepID=A0A2K1JLC5_PHYPA|nr:hypothetical protein PHYPA_017184 [Physcomitrium patens]